MVFCLHVCPPEGDLCEFEASLVVYSTRTGAKATKNPCLRNPKKKKKFFFFCFVFLFFSRQGFSVALEAVLELAL